MSGISTSPKIISKIGTFLNLRENQKCLGLFYIGKHNELAKRSLNKKDVNEKVEWL